MNETMTKGERLKVGLHAWNEPDNEKELAKRYGVSVEAVAKLKAEAKVLHERMMDKNGSRYWSRLGLERAPEHFFPRFGIGPTLSEHKEAERPKRMRGL